MKNRFIFLFFLIVALTSIFFVNCSKDEKTSYDTMDEVFKKSTYLEQQEILKNDQIVKSLYSLGLEYKYSLESSNKNKLPELHIEISNLVNQLYEKYGENNINFFVSNFEISNTNASNNKNPCELDQDGSVNYEECTGFWENFIVTIKVAFCPESPAEELYKCAQAAVCKTC